ncbi:MAG: ribonuclease III [Lachnospiraceae bacterium]|nr:ribonuclease III [Lachnospiraceae bacterium]
MEESITTKNLEAHGSDCDFREAVNRVFELKPEEAGMYSPLVLAYLGDAVYELMIRTILVSKGNIQVNKLNSQATKFVKASAQAAIAHAIAEELTQEEASIYRRGRNAKSYTVAKHATMSDYRHATGLEALCGFLYLKGESERLVCLLKKGLEESGLLVKGE